MRNLASVSDIGVARILFGGALFSKKVDDLFVVVAFKDRLNIPRLNIHPI